ncbi:MAG: dicarboxylate/amino acid:cation symporter [Gemmatimonadetes bacterium]|nr:dicarboxylate/amino acid:cation symporter [Gemmatimonadota bacterium]
MTPSVKFHPSLGVWAIFGAALGAALGLLGRGAEMPGIQVFAEWISPLGQLWMNALQMTVVPLVVTLLLSTMIRPTGARAIGGLGGRALALFLLMLLGAGLLTLVAGSKILGFFPVPSGLLESIQGQLDPAFAQNVQADAPATFLDWLVGLVPPNPLEAAVRGDLLQVLIFTVLVGAALGRLPEGQRSPLSGVLNSLSEAMLILVSWVLWGTPVGVLSIMLNLTLGAGLAVVGLVALFFFLVCGALVFTTGTLYPLASLLGRTPLKKFAKAALPAQVVAASTQSSIASLPALIEGGKEGLDLPEEATGFVLPLCVSAFKMNQPVSPTLKMLFLAHFFEVTLNLGDMLIFLMGSILLGFTSVGIPRGSPGFTRLPLYLAVGIPIEGYLLLEVVKQNPVYDACATVLNVTGDMAAATILTRDQRR